MKQFILLHEADTNSLVGVNVNEILCFTSKPQSNELYIDNCDDSEINIININEKHGDFIKRIGDIREFVTLHTVSSNMVVCLPKDIIKMVRQSSNSTSVILMNSSFESINVNESAASVIEMLNK